MGKKYREIGQKHQAFIEAQKIFFVATAPQGRRINLSPKGMDTFRVLTPNRVLWLNITGSGNETAAHLLEDDRMTVMFCSFEAEPRILRLYGRARAVHSNEAEWPSLIAQFPELPGLRQAIVMEVDLVHSSCGFAVPLFAFQGERPLLREWAEKKGEAGIREYWREENTLSLDGQPTGIPEA
jgi:hypothetical protein